MLLEPKAVTMFNECFTLYYQLVSKLRPSGKVVVAQDTSEMAPINGDPHISRQQVHCQEARWDGLDALCMSLLHLSFIIVERHESGTLSYSLSFFFILHFLLSFFWSMFVDNFQIKRLNMIS